MRILTALPLFIAGSVAYKHVAVNRFRYLPNHVTSIKTNGIFSTVRRSFNFSKSALMSSTETNTEVRLEDKNVPVAHAGLHDFLYGNMEDHGAADQSNDSSSVESFNGSRAYSVVEWLKEYEKSKLAAVYSVIGANGKVSYIGMSRNVALSLACHLQNEGPSKVALVKIQSYKYPKKSVMEDLRMKWISEVGFEPEGNKSGCEWAQTVKDASNAMISEARNSYEETKLKMRRAMADSKLADELDELEKLGDTESVRRAKLEMAVENDNWSYLIDQQTADTIQSKDVKQNASQSEKSTPQELIKTGLEPLECKDLEFTVENVDKVLDEVRPYLISDGGNCRVVAVDQETRIVSLALQGACGSCPSSTTTMQMGIERVLKENFKNLGGVIRVEENGNALSQVTADIVESILEPIKPAIIAMNGKIKVVSAFDGIVTLAFSGSPKIKYGIELACRDNPLVQEVKFVDFI